jgi:hypothetical protein
MALEKPNLLAYRSSLGTKNLELRSVYSTTVHEAALNFYRFEYSSCGNTVTEAKRNQYVKNFRNQVLEGQVTRKDTQKHRSLLGPSV